MSAQSFEVTLARLYTDPTYRKYFLDNPEAALAACDLSDSERKDLSEIDKAGLLMASRSFYHKRKKRLSSRSIMDRAKLFFRQLFGGA